jgi:hypothetical protein
MPHDLDDELLRAFVARDPRRATRLVHPFLGHLIEGLVARLVADGYLERAGDDYAPTELARAYLEREPELLACEEVTRPDVPLPPDVVAR